LIVPLKKCRFDYRFHVAHALGILGGPEAERALQDLARNDPFPAVREEAARALSALRASAALAGTENLPERLRNEQRRKKSLLLCSAAHILW
jgi:hypothetical protein